MPSLSHLEGSPVARLSRAPSVHLGPPRGLKHDVWGQQADTVGGERPLLRMCSHASPVSSCRRGHTRNCTKGVYHGRTTLPKLPKPTVAPRSYVMCNRSRSSLLASRIDTDLRQWWTICSLRHDGRRRIHRSAESHHNHTGNSVFAPRRNGRSIQMNGRHPFPPASSPLAPSAVTD